MQPALRLVPALLRHCSGAAAGAAAAPWRQQQRQQCEAAAQPQPPSAQEVRAAFEHCAQLVRQHDPENFVWVVQLPQAVRLRVLALRAFNLESLLIAEQVKSREPLVLQIRYQWWRDAVGGLGAAAAPPGHPVLTALWHAQHGGAGGAAGGAAGGGGGGSSGFKLNRYQLRRILDAREQDAVAFQAPLTLAELEAYAEATASQLQYLQLAAAGVASHDADHAASHLGKAVGLALLLRGAAFQAGRRRCYLPLELLAAHGVSQEQVYRGGPAPEGLRDVALAVGGAALGHLREARRLGAGLPRAAAGVMAGGVLAGQFLAALERVGFDLFEPRLAGGGASPLRRALAIKWAALRGTF
ncbi:NDUFAF6 [Scenedesmus sp. PABB004]|nr:NDUFAF6 [Scenedesmus sp. PABB004]